MPYPDTSEAPGNLLAPEPAIRTGALIGYARVSTSGQLLDRQLHALAEAGCLRVFADKLSGKNADRPELAACLDYLRPGDTLVVPSLDRLSRSLADLIAIVGTLRRHGVGFKSLQIHLRRPGQIFHFALERDAAEFRMVAHDAGLQSGPGKPELHHRTTGARRPSCLPRVPRRRGPTICRQGTADHGGAAVEGPDGARFNTIAL